MKKTEIKHSKIIHPSKCLFINKPLVKAILKKVLFSLFLCESLNHLELKQSFF
jgi:hypothetical protein